HDRARHEQLDERVAGLGRAAVPADRVHDAFLVFTVTRRASPAIRVREKADATRACSLATGVTSTWMTIVLFGFVGSGWIDHRRIYTADPGGLVPVPTQPPPPSRKSTNPAVFCSSESDGDGFRPDPSCVGG